MKRQKLKTVYSYHPKIIANSVQNNFSFTLILNEVAEIACQIFVRKMEESQAKLFLMTKHYFFVFLPNVVGTL
jgi:hypothetical protein